MINWCLLFKLNSKLSILERDEIKNFFSKYGYQRYSDDFYIGDSSVKGVLAVKEFDIKYCNADLASKFNEIKLLRVDEMTTIPYLSE